jgi:HEPN domain-containing protein
MNDKEVAEWFEFADDDFESAKILNASVRRPHEIICYHCAQAVEKYLKGYLIWNDITPERTHNLRYLNDICIEKDKAFENMKTACDISNRFNNDIRYPHKHEINEDDINFAINTVEKIKNLKPIINIRAKLGKTDKENNAKQLNCT